MSKTTLIFAVCLGICLVAQLSPGVGAVDKATFDSAVDSLPETCQNTISSCRAQSAKGQKLYREEKFCELMFVNDNGLTTKDCLIKDSCSVANFDELKNVACGTQDTGGRSEERKAFEDKIDTFSTSCQEKISSCKQMSVQGQSLYAKEKFCDLMNLNDNGVTTQACLETAPGCTNDNFNELKDVACGAGTIILSFLIVLLCALSNIWAKM